MVETASHERPAERNQECELDMVLFAAPVCDTKTKTCRVNILIKPHRATTIYWTEARMLFGKGESPERHAEHQERSEPNLSRPCATNRMIRAQYFRRGSRDACYAFQTHLTAQRLVRSIRCQSLSRLGYQWYRRHELLSYAGMRTDESKLERTAGFR